MFFYFAYYHLFGFKYSLILGALFHVHDKVDHIAGFPAGKAVVGVCLWVNLHAGCAVLVEGAAQVVVFVGF